MRAPLIEPSFLECCGSIILLNNRDLTFMFGRDAVDLDLLCAGAGTKTEQKNDGKRPHFTGALVAAAAAEAAAA